MSQDSANAPTQRREGSVNQGNDTDTGQPPGSRRNNRNRNRSNWNSNTAYGSNSGGSFEGAHPDLKQYTYDVDKANGNQEQFVNTTRGIAKYVAREFAHAGEFRLGMQNMVLPAIDKPAEPDEMLGCLTWNASSCVSNTLSNVVSIVKKISKGSSHWSWDSAHQRYETEWKAMPYGHN